MMTTVSHKFLCSASNLDTSQGLKTTNHRAFCEALTIHVQMRVLTITFLFNHFKACLVRSSIKIQHALRNNFT